MGQNYVPYLQLNYAMVRLQLSEAQKSMSELLSSWHFLPCLAMSLLFKKNSGKQIFNESSVYGRLNRLSYTTGSGPKSLPATEEYLEWLKKLLAFKSYLHVRKSQVSENLPIPLSIFISRWAGLFNLGESPVFMCLLDPCSSLYVFSCIPRYKMKRFSEKSDSLPCK